MNYLKWDGAARRRGEVRHQTATARIRRLSGKLDMFETDGDQHVNAAQRLWGRGPAMKCPSPGVIKGKSQAEGETSLIRGLI